MTRHRTDAHFWEESISETAGLEVSLGPVNLVERESHLEALRSWLDDAANGNGRLVFVGGEAGAGKSALVTEFCRPLPSNIPIYWGACEPLSAPRPLGPLADMAGKLGTEIQDLMRRGDRNGVFDTTITALTTDRSLKVMVFEDAHWADESTFDLLQFLARRIAAMSVLVVVTFRDDGVDSLGPMGVLLGDVASLPVVRRMDVPPLTLAGVRLLASDSGMDVERLHRDTGGNAFFVTEVLRHGSHIIPANVVDAVLARVRRLQASVRGAIEAAAVVGATVEPEIALGLADVGPPELDECVTSGFLITDGRALVFRHELTRQAVLGAIPPRRRAELHAGVLEQLRALSSEPEHLARLAEHAEEAGDASAVLEFAPAAAAAALSLGAHREAAFQYGRALRFASGLEPRERADLLERMANECYLIDERDEAIEAWKKAIDLWEQLDERVRVGDDYRQLACGLINSGRRSESEAAADRAVEVLEPLGPGPELAMAYAEQCGLSMLAEDAAATIEWANKTTKIAEEIGHTQALARVSNFVGVVSATAGDPEGEALIERSLEMAVGAGLEDEATWAYMNLAYMAFLRLDLTAATKYYEAGLSYCDEHDLYSSAVAIQAGLADVRFWSGHWDEAAELCKSAMGSNRVSRIEGLAVLARIRARRRDPGVWPLLEEARVLASETSELQYIGMVAAARAEAKWLSGQDDQIAAEVRPSFALACEVRNPWLLGELGWWLWRVGELGSAPQGAARPFAAQIDGDWREAAAIWAEHGFPYESAMALIDSTEEFDLRTAADTFDRLGAVPAREFARRRMRELGVSKVPRGRRASTRRNPAGLTSREMEVLGLVSAGMHDSEIAKAMFLSTRTVSHHVSAILAKLGVTSREEAVERARQILSSSSAREV